jgi:capsular polysaccharide biosynthesis protein
LLAVPLVIVGVTAVSSVNERVQSLEYRATATILLEGNAGASNFPRMATTRPALASAIKRAGLSVTVDELGAAVSVRLVPGTDFLEINAIHGQPAVAAEYANVVAEDFVRYVAGVRGSQLISARAELPKQLAKRGELISSQKVAD